MASEQRIGWGWPVLSRKAHFFNNDAVSICRRWMYTGPVDRGDFKSIDDCAACRRWADRHAATSAAPMPEAGQGGDDAQES